MTQWKGESVSEEEYNFNTFGKNKGQTGGALSDLSMEEPKTTGGMVTQTTEPKKEASQAEQLVDWLRSPITQAAGVAVPVAVGAGMAVKGLLGRGKNATQEAPRVEPTFTEPPPFAPQKTAQPDVTDVASRPVGQSRPQLTGPTTITPPASNAPSASTVATNPVVEAVAGGAPSPTNVAPAPVAPAPAPIDPIMQAKLDAIADKNRRENEAHAAQQRRLDEIHQTKLANEAKRAESNLQKNQGKTASTTSVDAQATELLVKSEENKLSKAVASATAPKPVTSAVPPSVATAPTPTSPITAATPADTPPPNTPPTDTVGASQERRPSYSAKRNRRAGEEIGQGGWHWYQGQMGPEAEANWIKTYGETNQSAKTVQQDIASGKLPGPTVVEGRGGSFSREATVPHFIKGNASVKGMASLGTLAAALGLAGSEKGQEAMGKAAKAIKDIGFSPDILTNKAEEMGRLGTGYVTAGNPSYRRELEQKLKSTTDPEFRRLLEQELTKISPSSNSPYRSVPPPR